MSSQPESTGKQPALGCFTAAMLCRSNFHGLGSVHGPWVQLRRTAAGLLGELQIDIERALILIDTFATHFSTSLEKPTESQM
jgi:hypothetical protein